MSDLPLRSILLVDDDRSVLSGLQHVLRPERHRLSVRAADGGVSALAAMAREPADVLVTDLRMPGMDGLELLERVMAEWPGTARILLSGWADLDTIIRAGAVAHRYLTKPCEAESLRRELADVCEAQDRLPDPRLRAALGSIRSLPVSPSTVAAMDSLPDDSRARARIVAEAVASDVALAVRVVQLAGSPSFGAPHPIAGLQEALHLLGPDLLRAVTATLEPLASASVLPGAATSLEGLEHHARSTARVARIIAPDGAAADEIATAALLHDAGRLALLTRLPGPYLETVQLAARSGRSLPDVERDVLGTTHAQVGAYLLGLWGLPRSIVDAVARHHDDSALEGSGEDVAAVVATANLLAHHAEASERSGRGSAFARSFR
jgi:putative nucleotidyltransferase with HDIG domain